MKQYSRFYFERYEWDAKAREVRMHYSLDREVKFVHTVSFDFEPDGGYNASALDRVLRGLWLMAGVSYYKVALPGEIVVEGFQLSEAEAQFFSETYRLGLGQLCYENKLSLDRVAKFPHGSATVEPVTGLGAGGDLVALGGGKDSLVSTAVLEAAGSDFATFSATYSEAAGKALEQQGAMLKRPHLAIRRRFDSQMLELNHSGGYNGHVPVTAELMLIGLAAAVLAGRRRVIFSDEASAGEGSVTYEGAEINHQYSKSLPFERAMHKFVRDSISPDLAVFSLLRPLGELRIAQLFAAGPLAKFSGHFTSCNRSFRHGSRGFTWCGECSKCAFVYLALAPFVPKQQLMGLWGGQNLLAKPELAETYRELLGLSGHKPFECVGEIEECRQAIRMLAESGDYPEAEQFGIPPGEYDWRQWHPDVMPERYRDMLHAYVKETVRHEA